MAVILSVEFLEVDWREGKDQLPKYRFPGIGKIESDICPNRMARVTRIVVGVAGEGRVGKIAYLIDLMKFFFLSILILDCHWRPDAVSSDGNQMTLAI